MSADFALIYGKILTMNPSQPFAEAIAIKQDRIIKVGSNKEINQLIGESTKTINLCGKTLVPGFIDTHIHVADFGKFLMWIDLHEVKSIKKIQSVLKERVQRTLVGKWIIGQGWNQKYFAEKRLLTRYDLDVVSSNNPVIFYHQSGQLCIANSKALELAGVTKQTSNPQGGIIDKNEGAGELTGILRDNATNLVWNMVPEPSEDELLEFAGLACEKIVEAGITSVHWMVLSPIEVSIVKKLRAQNRLPLRVYVIIPANLLDCAIGPGLHKAPADNDLRIGGAVIFADGYLAARTAALFQPYSDSPKVSGKLLCGQEEMKALAVRIHKAGLQLIIHAVGDKAVDEALTSIEETSTGASESRLRSRIEQAAVLNEALLQRMKRQKVIVSVQPRVIDSEFSTWSARDHLGPERTMWLYPVKTLLEEGIKVVGGSDCPMEPLNPLLGIQAAVMRTFSLGGQITIDEAMRMYTVDAAYSSGEERVKGSIEEGKLADLTVLSCDPRTVSSNAITNIAVEMTIIGGKVVYSKH